MCITVHYNELPAYDFSPCFHMCFSWQPKSCFVLFSPLHCAGSVWGGHSVTVGIWSFFNPISLLLWFITCAATQAEVLVSVQWGKSEKHLETGLEKDLCKQHRCSVLLPHLAATKILTQFVEKKVDTDSTFKKQKQQQQNCKIDPTQYGSNHGLCRWMLSLIQIVSMLPCGVSVMCCEIHRIRTEIC